MIYLADQFIAIEDDTKNPVVVTNGSASGTIINHSNSRGSITRDTFLPHMQRTTLKVRILTGKVLFSSSIATYTRRIRLRNNFNGCRCLHMGLP